jgi:hypothetical protein
MNTYIAQLEDDNVKGVYAISLVNDPAMESNFIALSKEPQKVVLATVNEEKRILMGAVLIPDKPVYRVGKDGEEYNLIFPAKTIRAASEKFFQNGYQNESTIEHSEAAKIEGVTIVESWIKEDEEKDKSVAYGINEPVGTWFASMKVNNDEVWNDYVQTGQVKGFSIDGLFNFEQVKLNKQIDMELNIKQWIADGFAALSKSAEKVELGSVQTAGENPIAINFEGEQLLPNLAITMTSPEGEELPVPAGEYPLADGHLLIVGEGSLVSEVKKAEPKVEVEIEVEQPEVEEVEAGDKKIKSEKMTQEVIYMSKEDFVALVSEIGKTIDAKLSTLKAELSKQDDEPVALTKAKGKAVKTWEEMTPLERFRASK